MLILKKFLFAPFFIVSLYLAFYFFIPFLSESSALLSFDKTVFINLFWVAFFIFLASYFFIIFASLAGKFVYVLPVAILGAALFFGFNLPGYLFLGILFLASLLVGYWTLKTRLKSSTDFSAVLVLGPSAQALAKFTVIVFAIAYLFSIRGLVSTQKITLPSSFINSVTSSVIKSQTGTDISNLPPSVSSSINSAVSAQFQKAIEPYSAYFPWILMALFLITVYSFIWIILVFAPLLLWMVFKILEKTNLIHFKKEMREVKILEV